MRGMGRCERGGRGRVGEEKEVIRWKGKRDKEEGEGVNRKRSCKGENMVASVVGRDSYSMYCSGEEKRVKE